MTRSVWRAMVFACGVCAIESCLDLTPNVVATDTDASIATSATCVRCISTPSTPGPGCAEQLAGCEHSVKCTRAHECALQKGCYSGTSEELAICSRNCAQSVGIVSADDPEIPVAF